MIKKYEVLNELVPKTQELHRAIFDKGYIQGQQDVLCGIIAEIESIERYGTVNGHDIWLKTPEEIKKEVFKIIDKYREGK